MRDCLHAEQEIACKRSASELYAEQEIAGAQSKKVDCKRSVSVWYAEQEFAHTQSKKLLARGQRQYHMQSRSLLTCSARNCLQEVGVSMVSRAGVCLHTEREIACERLVSVWYAEQEFARMQNKKLLSRGQCLSVWYACMWGWVSVQLVIYMILFGPKIIVDVVYI